MKILQTANDPRTKRALRAPFKSLKMFVIHPLSVCFYRPFKEEGVHRWPGKRALICASPKNLRKSSRELEIVWHLSSALGSEAALASEATE